MPHLNHYVIHVQPDLLQQAPWKMQTEGDAVLSSVYEEPENGRLRNYSE